LQLKTAMEVKVHAKAALQQALQQVSEAKQASGLTDEEVTAMMADIAKASTALSKMATMALKTLDTPSSMAEGAPPPWRLRSMFGRNASTAAKPSRSTLGRFVDTAAWRRSQEGDCGGQPRGASQRAASECRAHEHEEVR
jgi:hypothetical protein